MQKVRGGGILRSGYSKYFTEITNGVRRSILQLRARSEAAVLPFGPQKSRKNKRIAFSDRRASVESYVARYMAANAGKFPNVSAVKKEVGGSYYTVRKIVQELQYRLKVHSPNIENGSSSTGGVVKDEVVSSVSEVKDVLQTVIVEDTQMSGVNDKQEDAGRSLTEGIVEDERERLMTEDDVASTVFEMEEIHTSMVKDIQMGNITDKQVKDVGGSQTNGIAEDKKLTTKDEVSSTVFGTKEEFNAVIVKDIRMIEISHKQVEDTGGLQAEEVVEETKLVTKDEEPLISETKKEVNTAVFKDIQIDEISDRQVEAAGGSQPESRSEHMLLDGVPGPKIPNHHDNLDATSRNLKPICFPQEQKQAIDSNSDAEPTRTSSFWGNLKSFADGIVNIWRKL